MDEPTSRDEIQHWTETVSGEIYEELLNRYERILVYAGQLQEQLKQQKLLAEKNDALSEENARLKKLVAVEESYVKLLENALRSLGVFPERDPTGD